MKTMHTLVAVVLGALASTAQAQTRPEEPQVGAAVAAFEMRYAQRSPEEITTRLQMLAAVMTGKALRVDGIDRLAKPADAAWQAPFADAPHLLARYLPEVDELRLLDEQATLSLEPKTVIDEPTALKTAAWAVKQLASVGLIDPRHYDIKRAQIGYHRALAGSRKSGRPEVNRVTEYRITLRPALNGIEVATAGLRVGVHADGRIISLRLGGATAKTIAKDGFDLPSGAGRYLTRRISDDELDRRFLTATPISAQPRVHWARLMYAMPEGATSAVVEPLRIYAHSLLTDSDGAPIVSRRKLIGLSTTDPGAAPVDYTPPTPPVKEVKRPG